jgi:hypothetical protein
MAVLAKAYSCPTLAKVKDQAMEDGFVNLAARRVISHKLKQHIVIGIATNTNLKM